MLHWESLKSYFISLCLRANDWFYFAEQFLNNVGVSSRRLFASIFCACSILTGILKMKEDWLCWEVLQTWPRKQLPCTTEANETCLFSSLCTKPQLLIAFSGNIGEKLVILWMLLWKILEKDDQFKNQVRRDLQVEQCSVTDRSHPDASRNAVLLPFSKWCWEVYCLWLAI